MPADRLLGTDAGRISKDIDLAEGAAPDRSAQDPFDARRALRPSITPQAAISASTASSSVPADRCRGPAQAPDGRRVEPIAIRAPRRKGSAMARPWPRRHPSPLLTALSDSRPSCSSGMNNSLPFPRSFKNRFRKSPRSAILACRQSASKMDSAARKGGKNRSSV